MTVIVIYKDWSGLTPWVIIDKNQKVSEQVSCLWFVDDTWFITQTTHGTYFTHVPFTTVFTLLLPLLKCLLPRELVTRNTLLIPKKSIFRPCCQTHLSCRVRFPSLSTLVYWCPISARRRTSTTTSDPLITRRWGSGRHFVRVVGGHRGQSEIDTRSWRDAARTVGESSEEDKLRSTIRELKERVKTYKPRYRYGRWVKNRVV